MRSKWSKLLVTFVCGRLSFIVIAACIVSAVVYILSPSRPIQIDHEKIRVPDPSTSCGPVSLSIICEMLGQPHTITECHDVTKAGELGTCSFEDLLRGIREFGLHAKAVKYNPSILPRHKLPMILYVDGNHFLVAKCGWDNRLAIVDPPLAPVISTWAALAKRWKGHAIVVGNSHDDLAKAFE